MDNLDDLFNAVLDGDMDGTAALVQAALDAGAPPSDILQEGLIGAMDEVGCLFQEGEYFVPEMLIAARAMKAGLAILRPHLVTAGVESSGKVLLGTVEGDMHDIGKDLVGMMLEGAGFDIIDLGTDVTPQKFVGAIQADDVDIVGVSALLTTTLPNLKETVAAIDAAGLRDRVKVIVGGAPVTAEFAKQIGADGYADDAGQAAALAKAVLA